MSSHNTRKHKTRKHTKIHPDDDAEGLINEGFELDSIKQEKRNNTNPFVKVKNATKSLRKIRPHNPINMITNIKQGAQRWKTYAAERRKAKSSDGMEGVDRRKTGGDGLTAEMGTGPTEVDTQDGTQATTASIEMIVIHNRILIEYFARLGQSDKENETINLEHIESLLEKGANINCTDKYGQTVLHEAARAWNVDVAKFLMKECHANPNKTDYRGRTPLHVAAAVDYPEMVELLIDSGGDKEARTQGELQTPVHFAARNDACSSLKMLMRKGCEYKTVRDYKGRTPLHVAAELDRSETARMLLEVDDPAPAGVQDDSGQSAIVWMITKMPPVAKIALDQFHTMDRANRKQFYHLNWLEPREPDDEREMYPQTAMRVAVIFQRLDLIVHPVFLRLNRIKWFRFGRFGAIFSTVVNALFILLWTLLGILVNYDKKHIYVLPDQWWRIILFFLAFLLTCWQIKEELKEFFISKKAHTHWENWRKKEIERDMQYTHDRWPEEKLYLQQEIKELDKIGPQYFNDFWNIFDWICYTLLLICIITHLVDVFKHTDFNARLHIRIMSITIILIWLRLMKNARAFSLLGPFIVIIGHMLSDVLKFGFLYLEFFIPYACAFWMIFGGERVPEEFQGLPGASNYTIVVSGLADPAALLVNLFRLTLVDDYDYYGMKSIDSIMTVLLVCSWLALSAILMLNLFIALMSDTFQRVYDNANANAVMQKAITILSIEEGLSSKRRRKFRQFIHTKCKPEVDFYDDDATSTEGEDLKKVTFQIKDDLTQLSELWHEQFNPYRNQKKNNEDLASGDDLEDLGERLRGYINDNHRDNEDDARGLQGRELQRLENEVEGLRDDISEIQDQHHKLADRFKRDMSQIKTLLQQIAMATIGAVPPSGGAESTVFPKSSVNSASSESPDMARLLEIDGPVPVPQRFGPAAVMQRPPTGGASHSVSLINPASNNMVTSRTNVMDVGAPGNAFGSLPLIQPTVQPSKPDDTEWDRLEKKLKDDKKNLRGYLSEQQKLAANQNLMQQASGSEGTDDTSVSHRRRRKSKRRERCASETDVSRASSNRTEANDIPEVRTLATSQEQMDPDRC